MNIDEKWQVLWDIYKTIYTSLLLSWAQKHRNDTKFGLCLNRINHRSSKGPLSDRLACKIVFWSIIQRILLNACKSISLSSKSMLYHKRVENEILKLVLNYIMRYRLWNLVWGRLSNKTALFVYHQLNNKNKCFGDVCASLSTAEMFVLVWKY